MVGGVVAVGSRLVSPSPSAAGWGSALLVLGTLVVAFLACVWVGDRLALGSELNRWLDELLGQRDDGKAGQGWGRDAPTDPEAPEAPK